MFRELYEYGLVPIPISKKSKQPVKDAAGFNQWSIDGIPEEMIDLFESKYPIDKGYGVAVVLGPASGIVCVDIDTEDKEVMNTVPMSLIRRRGKKGEARFFKYNSALQNCNFDSYGNGKPSRSIDILIKKKYIILPPSIHPDTNKPYVWLTMDTLENFDRDLLTELTENDIDAIARLHGQDSFSNENSSVELKGEWNSPDGNRAPHGSYNRIKALSHALIADNTPLDDAIKKLIEYDKKHHLTVPFFEDKRRASDFGADPFSNATRLYGNFLKSTNEERLRKGELPQVPEEAKLIDVSQLLTNQINRQVFKPYPEPRGIMKKFADYCDLMGKGRQDALSLGGAISLMATLVSNRFQSEVRGLDVWGNCFVLNLGYSSFGKDVSQRLLDDLLCDHELIGSANYKSGTSIVQSLPTQQERLDLIDECSFLLKAMNEGSSFQTEMVEMLSLIFTRSSTRFNGIASVENGNRFGAAYNPCVNILASTTPMGFKESVNKAMAQKGLMPRFLMFFQKEVGKYRGHGGSQKVKKAKVIKKELQKYVEEILTIAKPVDKEFAPPVNLMSRHQGPNNQDVKMGYKYAPHMVPMTKEAHKHWMKYEEKNHNLSAKNPNSFESAFYGRFAEIVAKVALFDKISLTAPIDMITSGITGDECDLEVELENVQWAIDVVETCWYNSQPLYELATAENKQEANLVRVLAIIKEATAISARDLSRKTQWLTAEQRDGILKSLVQTEKITMGQDKQKKSKAGRAAIVYAFNYV